MTEDSDVADVFGAMMSERTEGSTEGISSQTDFESGDDKTTTDPGAKMTPFQFIEKPDGEIGNNGGLIWDREAVLRSAQQIYQRHNFKNEKDKGDFLRFVCQAFGFATNNITDISQIEDVQQADPNEPVLRVTIKDDKSRAPLNAISGAMVEDAGSTEDATSEQ